MSFTTITICLCMLYADICGLRAIIRSNNIVFFFNSCILSISLRFLHNFRIFRMNEVNMCCITLRWTSFLVANEIKNILINYNVLCIKVPATLFHYFAMFFFVVNIKFLSICFAIKNVRLWYKVDATVAKGVSNIFMLIITNFKFFLFAS